MQLNINLSKCRWMLFTNRGKLVVENHNQKITWKKVYKEEFGNMKALCFQMIPSGKKIFAKESPYGEYWTFEEFEVLAGQSVPTHLSRNLCSLMDKKLGIWNVLTVDAKGNHTYRLMSNNEIGYETRMFINREDKERARQYV